MESGLRNLMIYASVRNTGLKYDIYLMKYASVCKTCLEYLIKYAIMETSFKFLMKYESVCETSIVYLTRLLFIKKMRKLAQLNVNNQLKKS